MAKKGRTTSKQNKGRTIVRERISRKGSQRHERANVSMRPPPRKPDTSGNGGTGSQSSGGNKPEASTGGSQGGESTKK